MLIPGKSHSRVDSRNSRVSIETLDFARVQCTVYWRERSWIACGGARGGGGDRRPVPMLFPADAGTLSIDQHSRLWRTRNVAKRLEATGGARPGTCNGRSARGRRAGESPCRPSSLPVGRRWTIGRRCRRMGKQDGGQRPDLRRSGAPVKKQTCSATGGRDRRPAPGCRVQETTGLLSGGHWSRFSEVEKFLSRDREKRSRLLSCLSKMQIVCHKQSVCIPGKLLP